MTDRDEYIDAIKGIACFGVFLHHFFVILLPATYTGLKKDSVVRFDYLFGSSPIGFIINGNFWVCCFLMISAFLLSKSVFQNSNDGKKVSVSLAKRYPRLMLPVLAANILGFCLIKLLNLLGDEVTDIFAMSFWNVIKVSVFDIWFVGNVGIAGYWMMNLLFMGSIIAIILAMILSYIKRPLFARSFLLLLLIVLSMISTYYVATVLGIWLVYEMNRFNNRSYHKEYSRYVKLLFFSLLLFVFFLFAGYPSSGCIYMGFYAWANYLLSILKNSPQLFHIIASLILLFTLTVTQSYSKKFFSANIFRFSGKISYAVFLVHPFINAMIAVRLFDYLNGFVGVGWSVFITAFISMILCCIISYLFYILVESPLNVLVNLVINKVFGN